MVQRSRLTDPDYDDPLVKRVALRLRRSKLLGYLAEMEAEGKEEYDVPIEIAGRAVSYTRKELTTVIAILTEQLDVPYVEPKYNERAAQHTRERRKRAKAETDKRRLQQAGTG